MSLPLSAVLFRRSTSRLLAKVSKRLPRLVSLADSRYLVFMLMYTMVLTMRSTPSEMAFHIAGSMAFKDAMQKGYPILLEPIMKVEVTMPEEYMGDVIGDINSRRGRIEGMDDIGGGKMVKAMFRLLRCSDIPQTFVPETQGRGNYSMFFEKYEPVPKSVQEKGSAAKAK